MFVTVFALLAFAVIAGCGLHALSRRTHKQQNSTDKLTEHINRCLPQLQCGECNYPGCRPYAAAIAKGEADITLCPPGGDETVISIANLLNIDAPMLTPPPPRRVAFIREEDCVGCALCLPVCPTDAIIGAARQKHVVITDDCVGCNLCLPPCPMNCIEMRLPTP